MNVNLKMPTVTSVAKGFIAYLKIVFMCGATAGAIVGNGYANEGRPLPNVSEIGPTAEEIGFAGEFFIPFIMQIAQFFATVSYSMFYWIPFPLFGLMLMGIIAYVGIYRNLPKGWLS